jgi:hypothetical protein
VTVDQALLPGSVEQEGCFFGGYAEAHFLAFPVKIAQETPLLVLLVLVMALKATLAPQDGSS